MKLYYDCPIKAVYMAKYFAVHFKSERGQSLYFDGGSDFRTEKDCGIYMGEKFYINPNSLHIFEVQENDMIETQGILLHLHNLQWKGKDCKIIQRNNLPFIMPKEEN